MQNVMMVQLMYYDKYEGGLRDMRFVCNTVLVNNEVVAKWRIEDEGMKG